LLALCTAVVIAVVMDSSRSLSGACDSITVWLACTVADSSTSRADAMALSAADSRSENVFRSDPCAAMITLFSSGFSSSGPGGERPCMRDQLIST
jgi:hypothetical protein